MTGFGHAEVERDGMLVTADIRSYNNRFLDLAVVLPSYLAVLEPKVRVLVSGRVERGKVEVAVRITEYAERGTIVVDEALARSYIQAMNDLSRHLDKPEKPGLGHLVRMDGVFRIRHERDEARTWEIIRPVVSEALTMFGEARDREGSHTLEDIGLHLETLGRELGLARSLAPALEEKIRQNLRGRLMELVGDTYDETRLLTETAQTLTRFDVNEELSRMGAHLDAFRAAAFKGGACGKMLDFVCQELHREINTLGSKSFVLEMDQIVLRMKDALEKIREQVRNVE